MDAGDGRCDAPVQRLAQRSKDERVNEAVDLQQATLQRLLAHLRGLFQARRDGRAVRDKEHLLWRIPQRLGHGVHDGHHLDIVLQRAGGGTVIRVEAAVFSGVADCVACLVAELRHHGHHHLRDHRHGRQVAAALPWICQRQFLLDVAFELLDVVARWQKRQGRNRVAVLVDRHVLGEHVLQRSAETAAAGDQKRFLQSEQPAAALLIPEQRLPLAGLEDHGE
mmetsp:Transcript_13897/g.39542  ORF Transcript_13897/g.39542 Transcript_13897/m.39542 type:complete len:223 (+) Transcript_13897:846-1514(+)